MNIKISTGPAKKDTLPGVILAAGRSQRFGSENKLLKLFKGKAIIYHVVINTLKSKLNPILIVTGFENEKILQGLGDLKNSSKLQVVFNPSWISGRTSSIKRSIKQLTTGTAGVVFLQGDMPLMTTQLINKVTTVALETKKLSFPIYKGDKGHPVFFPQEMFSDLLGLEGDTTGYNLVKKYWEKAVKFPLQNENPQFDLDTKEDYHWLKNRPKH